MEEVKKGRREIAVCVREDGGETSDQVIGVAMLDMPVSENGPWRGRVEKLLVSPTCRRRGIGRALMEKVEMVAREKGRWLLVSEGGLKLSRSFLDARWKALED